MITSTPLLAAAVALLGLGNAPDAPARSGGPGTEPPSRGVRDSRLPVLRPKLALASEKVATPAAGARARAALVDRALGALRTEIGPLSHPDALRMAFGAYYSYQATYPRHVRNPYLYFVDFGLDSDTPRGYVFDMRTLQVVDGPFTVAHGRGSSPYGEAVPTAFSNRPGSNATSLGLYVTQETYTFNGTAWGRHYQSVGLRLAGVSGAFNNKALSRKVVAHGAPYVTPEQAGRSEGCPAMEQERAERLLPLISNGGLVFLFSPYDPTWMRDDPWARGATGRMAAAGR